MYFSAKFYVRKTIKRKRFRSSSSVIKYKKGYNEQMLIVAFLELVTRLRT